MKKYLYILSLFLACFTMGWAQKKLIYLDHSDKLEFDNEKWPDCQILIGNVQLRHENMIMHCDSAYFFDKNNQVIASGHIKMNQKDSLFIYGDKLFYDGDTRLARLRHNVRMINQQATLYTDSLNYDRRQNIGYYFTGGRIVDGNNVLVSVKGKFYPDIDLAVFQNDVVLTNPDFILTSDTLHYNTQTDIANILGPSNIVHQDSTFIYAERGWYDTQKDLSELTQNPHLHDLEGHYIAADTLFHDHKKHHSEAFSNVSLQDSTNNIIISGNYGWYNDSTLNALITKTPTLYYFEQDKQDTLYLTADTLQYSDQGQRLKLNAYHHVQSWHTDFQSLCDSAFYSDLDSTLRLYGTPVMWNDSNQHTGNEIHIFLANNVVKTVTLENNAFVFSRTDTIVYNQMSGKKIIAHFADNRMYKTEVMGNARSIYFVEDTDEANPSQTSEEKNYTGINQAESSNLTMYMNDRNAIKKIVMSPASNGTLYTPDKINQKKVTQLEGLHDYNNIRPKDKNDIYIPKNKETLKAAEATNKVRKRRRNLQ